MSPTIKHKLSAFNRRTIKNSFVLSSGPAKAYNLQQTTENLRYKH